MRLIALYVDGERRVLEESAAILSRANQALATLERYKLRLDEVAGTLSALEIEDLVTVRDVTAVAQRLEMVRRIATEIAEYVVELGTDGRLLSLQLDELIAGVEPERELVVRDYVPEPTAKRSRTVVEALVELNTLTHTELLELPVVARALGYSGSPETLDSAVSPRGYRLLAKVPRLPGAIIERLVEHFGGLQKLLAASVGRPPGGGRGGRGPGPERARGAVPAGGVLDSGAVRLGAPAATFPASAPALRPGMLPPVSVLRQDEGRLLQGQTRHLDLHQIRPGPRRRGGPALRRGRPPVPLHRVYDRRVRRHLEELGRPVLRAVLRGPDRLVGFGGGDRDQGPHRAEVELAARGGGVLGDQFELRLLAGRVTVLGVAQGQPD